MSKYYFRTEDLTVGYNGRPLIRNIDIQVEKGEILTLIGPNGSGKSTILKTITKQLKGLGGTVYIGSDSLGHMSYKQLSTKVAVVLTERIKPELMSCLDVVATGRYPYTSQLGLMTHDDSLKIREAMETVQALDIKDRDFNTISDGQKQRVMLARAICQEPEIIILDEPTSFLDIKHKLELLTILRTMAKEKGITVIMSLHEIDLAQKISDKIICVKGEHIERYGTPEEIFKDDLVRELYTVTQGSYNAVFGSVELTKPKGKPETFVISGGGTGIRVFRELQRNGTPFYAGILYENDIDYQVAQALAAKVFTERPFRSISDSAYEEAKEAMCSCKRVIFAGVEIGEINGRIEDLAQAADSLGILERI